MKQFFGLVLISLLVTSFQCQRWAEFSKDMTAKVEPETIILDSDTISFVLTVKFNHERFRNEETKLTLYALGKDHSEVLSQMDAQTATIKSVRHNLKFSEHILRIGMKVVNGNVESPILPIAFVQDVRTK